MNGFLASGEDKFFLVSDSFKASDYGLPHGTRLTEDRLSFQTPDNHVVPHATPIVERELWLDDVDIVVSLPGVVAYPFHRDSLFRLPPEVIKQVFASTRVTYQQGALHAELNWGGHVVTRTFRCEEQPLGVAVWPPVALPEWKGYYLLFGPGRDDAMGRSFFGGPDHLMPWSVAPSNELSESRVIANGQGAMIRTYDIPLAVGLMRAGAEGGVIPVRRDGQLFCPFGTGTWSASPSTGTSRVAPSTPQLAKVAVDFGTTNTAVAVAVQGGLPAQVNFSPKTCGVNLVPQLDAVKRLSVRNAFFPVTSPARNPMPTLLWDSSREVEPFLGSKSLPARAIPFDRMADDELRSHVQSLQLKQDFKWGEREIERSAFMDMLGRLVALQLWVDPATANVSTVDVVFTRPISFTASDRRGLDDARQAFGKALADGGLQVAAVEGQPSLPVSESLANLHKVLGLGAGGARDRYVVIDIGGGSSDIAVFRGGAESTGPKQAIHLDSLKIGGRDFVGTLLKARAATRSGAGAAFTRWLSVSELSLSNEHDADVLQQLFLARLEKHGVHETARQLEAAGLAGAMLDLQALLVAVAAYGIRLATVPEDPKLEHIKVVFSGLGSGLFDLAPTHALMANPRAAVLEALRMAVKKFTRVDLAFDWTSAEGKLAVCKGALVVPPTERGQPPSSTVWADLPRGATPASLHWNDVYTGRDELALQPPVVDWYDVSVDELERCVTFGIDAIAQVFDVRSVQAPSGLHKAMRDAWAEGAAGVVAARPDAPWHPVFGAVRVWPEVLGGVFP